MMAQKLKTPKGYGAVTPYFTVADADRLIDFLQQVFAGEVIKCDRYAKGHIQHARVRIGGSVVMLNQVTKEYPPQQSQMHVYVADAAAVLAKACAAGAVTTMTPNLRPHGDVMAGFEDPCGNRWWVAEWAGASD